MITNPNILLVEGESDRSFFKELHKMLHISADVVEVVTPKDIGHFRNGKSCLYKKLHDLLPQINDGTIEHLGIVVDADHSFNETLKEVSDILNPIDYSYSSERRLFAHEDGLPDIGLWIMPNNQHNGMLEDWIKTCQHPNEKTLFQHVQQSIDTIPNGAKFKELHRAKAEIATWLAWQKNPDHGLYYAVNPELLNTESESFQELKQWLQHLFPTASTTPA